jgi:CDGSH-type Zn-finger protein
MHDKPKIAGYGPIKQELEPGIYAYCTCGWSSNQPFCDGSHTDTDFEPILVTIEQKQKISWCNCKHSGKMPVCDATHKILKQELEDHIGTRLP